MKKGDKVLVKAPKPYEVEIKLIQSKDSEYKAGISIVPSYLAKGLEFDSVIIINDFENSEIFIIINIIQIL